ncbi:MAG: hypothetical protein ACOX6D_02405 [Thermoguttaceae bacterium]|jgi:hypothetical protein
MARGSLFEKLERDHQKLLEKIDELDQKIIEALNDWNAKDKEEEAECDSPDLMQGDEAG